MQFTIDHSKRRVVSGESSDYRIEVCHGGWGGQLGDRMLVSVIVKTVRRLGAGQNEWEADATLHLSLDRPAIEWLTTALADVKEGKEVGVYKTFS